MDKVILVTGASTGIGAATARALAKNNHVFVHYNSSEEQAKEVAASVEQAGGKATLVQADVRKESECVKLVQTVKDAAGRLDVLVNNAGGMVARQAISEIQWGEMEDIFQLNVFSLVKITSLCVPLMQAAKDPVIVNISSIVVRHGAAGATLYGAAKGAVDVFTRGMAKELAPKIRVAAIAPGVIETPFHEKVSTPEQLQSWREACPLKKNGKPEHIADTVVFLVENDFIHGETIDVNGGMFMR
jgi:3-oxoacyl-[acyl-carrier protein] reductase